MLKKKHRKRGKGQVVGHTPPHEVRSPCFRLVFAYALVFCFVFLLPSCVWWYRPSFVALCVTAFVTACADDVVVGRIDSCLLVPLLLLRLLLLMCSCCDCFVIVVSLVLFCPTFRAKSSGPLFVKFYRFPCLHLHTLVSFHLLLVKSSQVSQF